MDATLRFHQRLYQRGQLWTECVEEWTHQRHYFLERVRQSQVLDECYRFLQSVPPRRLLIIYGLTSLDSLFCLPHLGPTLARSEHLTTRYFCLEYYFPTFIDAFGRSSPKLIALDQNGVPTVLWGPRPQHVTEQMGEAGHGENRNMDRWLLKYVNSHYPLDLDRSIVQAFQQKLQISA